MYKVDEEILNSDKHNNQILDKIYSISNFGLLV